MNLLKRTNTKEYSIAVREMGKKMRYVAKNEASIIVLVLRCAHFLVYFIFNAIKYDILQPARFGQFFTYIVESRYVLKRL